MLINMGADLRLVPPKPFKDDGNYVKVASRLANELKVQIIMALSGQISSIIPQI